MADYRFIVTGKRSTLLPEDYWTNTLYYSRTLGSGDNDGLCQDLADIYASNWGGTIGDTDTINVRMYDMADSTPRPVVGEADATVTAVAPGPREVALVCSFYAERNLPQRRGRIFIGPFNGGNTGVKEVPGALMTKALDFMDDLAGLGGADVSWQQHSVVDNHFFDVTNTWVDNAWDTQRRRGQKATVRDARTV